jgi:hypothetical protein
MTQGSARKSNAQRTGPFSSVNNMRLAGTTKGNRHKGIEGISEGAQREGKSSGRDRM